MLLFTAILWSGPGLYFSDRQRAFTMPYMVFLRLWNVRTRLDILVGLDRRFMAGIPTTERCDPQRFERLRHSETEPVISDDCINSRMMPKEAAINPIPSCQLYSEGQ